MNFHAFVYVMCSCLAAVVLVQQFLDWRSRRRKSHAAVGNIDFLAFQKRFFAGYVFCLFSDSLQSPYLYYLYQSYGFLESQIAILYLCGLLTSLCFNVATMYLVQKTERKMLCLCYVAICSTSCLLKLSSNYQILLFGRILDGISGSLLGTAFTEWYLHEHVETNDFPKEWIPLTFRKVALLCGYLTIFAGFVAQFSEAALQITAAPFVLAAAVLMCGGAYIFKAWPANRFSQSVLAAHEYSLALAMSGLNETARNVAHEAQEQAMPMRFRAQLSAALQFIVRRPHVFLLSAVQSLFESTIYIMAFLWTPLFLYAKPVLLENISSLSSSQQQLPFGSIYACMMAAVLSGSLLHRILSRKLSPLFLLSLAICISLVSLAMAVSVLYAVVRSPYSGGTVLTFEVLLLILCTYQLGVGVYFPVMQRLQKDILPADNRSAVLAVFRIPLNLIASAGLVMLHGYNNQAGNWTLIIFCSVLLSLCLLACFALHSFVSSRQREGLLGSSNGLSLAQFSSQLRAVESDDD